MEQLRALLSETKFAVGELTNPQPDWLRVGLSAIV